MAKARTDRPGARLPATRRPSAGTTLEVVRGAYGGLQLVRPALLATRLLGVPPDRRRRRVVRVLGARHLGQAVLSGRRPTPRTLAVGASVDLLHALSMLAVAGVDRHRRRVAAADAIVAGGFALAGVLAARADA